MGRFPLLFNTFLAICSAASAQAEKVTERWEIGVVIHAETAPAQGILAAVPVPAEWPEQETRVIAEDLTPPLRRVTYRTVEGGARQMVVQVPRIGAGETVRAVLTFEVTKTRPAPYGDPSRLVIPTRLTREERAYLAPSPMIESTAPQIRQLAAELTSGKATPWEQAEAIYDGVRSRITYKEGEIKGALASLIDGDGDCEEMTSLFVALCRASKIPARSVWVPGHCYPEFLLADGEGNNHWIPCQAAGDRLFGEMPETRPILQKGDNFKLPEIPERLRYARVVLKSVPKPGFAHPQVEHVMQRVE